MPESICTRAAHEAGLSPSDLERLIGVARSAADAGGQEPVSYTHLTLPTMS